MKKLKLSLQLLKNTEVLTRHQLKTLFGGNSGSDENGSDNCWVCHCPGDFDSRCWYTTDTTSLCYRVHTTCPDVIMEPAFSCEGCRENNP